MKQKRGFNIFVKMIDLIQSITGLYVHNVYGKLCS